MSNKNTPARVKSKLLNKAQAEAVYSAMCALNNVGSKVRTCFSEVPGNELHVHEGAALARNFT